MTATAKAEARDARSDLVRGLAIWGVVFVHGSYMLLKNGAPLIPRDCFCWEVALFPRHLLPQSAGGELGFDDFNARNRCITPHAIAGLWPGADCYGESGNIGLLRGVPGTGGLRIETVVR